MVNVNAGRCTLDRMIAAIENVRQRLLHACAILETENILYAVARENASAYWIGQADPSAVRNTPAVEIAVRRIDLSEATLALTSAGFFSRTVNNKQYFLEQQEASLRHSVELNVVDTEKAICHGLRESDIVAAKVTETFRVLSLDSLLLQLLSSFRLIDRVCIRDLIDVGLIDDTWCDRLPDELAMRLRGILADPDG